MVAKFKVLNILKCVYIYNYYADIMLKKLILTLYNSFDFKERKRKKTQKNHHINKI